MQIAADSDELDQHFSNAESTHDASTHNTTFNNFGCTEEPVIQNSKENEEMSRLNSSAAI